MPTGSSSTPEEIQNPAPKFKTGDLVKVNLVALTNSLGMFQGLIPDIILCVKRVATPNPITYDLMDQNLVTRIPSCPENVLTKF